VLYTFVDDLIQFFKRLTSKKGGKADLPTLAKPAGASINPSTYGGL
jgi:hypothetical protein